MTVIAVFEVQPNPNATEEQRRNYDEYRSRVPALIASFGGKYLVRAGSGEAIEGSAAAARWHVIEFPDASAAKAFWSSPEYTALKPLRKGAAEVRAVLVSPPSN
jgi:uncharacterized protein (DUF1330 family)